MKIEFQGFKDFCFYFHRLIGEELIHVLYESGSEVSMVIWIQIVSRSGMQGCLMGIGIGCRE